MWYLLYCWFGGQWRLSTAWGQNGSDEIGFKDKSEAEFQRDLATAFWKAHGSLNKKRNVKFKVVHESELPKYDLRA